MLASYDVTASVTSIGNGPCPMMSETGLASASERNASVMLRHPYDVTHDYLD